MQSDAVYIINTYLFRW